MRMLAEFFPEFAEKLDEIDALYQEKKMIDDKTYQFICFALAIKGRSKPCVIKHFKGALEAGATVEELTYIFALTMREAAGADDCWTHDVLADWQEILVGNLGNCCCPRQQINTWIFIPGIFSPLKDNDKDIIFLEG